MFRPAEKLYPFASHWLSLNGNRMHFLDEGPRDAPVVLMLHGNPTWSFYYRNLVLALRDKYRCIVPDHIGCGLSDKPDDRHYSYTLSQRIADLAALTAHLKLDSPLHLLVHDWGGMIGFGWARHQPQRIASMVVANTAAFPMPAHKRLHFALWLARIPGLGALLIRGFNAFSGLAARVAFKHPVSAEVKKAYTGPYDSWRNRIATLRFVQDIPLQASDPGYDIVKNTGERLPAFSGKPCLLAWGEKDFVFDLHFLNRWIKVFPQAKVVRFPDCGHYIFEDAGEPLCLAVRDFLDNNEAGNSPGGSL